MCRKTILIFTGSCNNFGKNFSVCLATDLIWMIVPQLNSWIDTLAYFPKNGYLFSQILTDTNLTYQNYM